MTSEEKIYVVIDNDSCIGSWSDLSLLFALIKYYGNIPNVDYFAKLMEETVCIRPHMRNFYDKLMMLKRDGKIHGIFMCTACSNKSGWVDFLRLAIERWYGEKIYDIVVHLETIQEYHSQNQTPWENSVGIIKDMQLFVDTHLCDPSGKFIVFDDNPNIYNHSKLFTVPAYNVAVNLVEVIRLHLPELYPMCDIHHHNLCKSWHKYRMFPWYFTNAQKDDIFLRLCDELNSVV
jgi:hypothetical protein